MVRKFRRWLAAKLAPGIMDGSSYNSVARTFVKTKVGETWCYRTMTGRVVFKCVDNTFLPERPGSKGL
jgi:hypothetical protein